ncbi:PAS domain-containing protein [Phaeodactylibacter xiamenensis]|jgi:photoactive yellow protein|uniref:PAS domain-containing protein n=1 Tax=Phaeodactylibacter xiamenensis TaxID=1524460 RepID=UPI0024A8D8E7|nr:PAS domain-containing protein [Phaeodactylibacter xiamenensis]
MHNFEAPDLHQWLDGQRTANFDHLPYGVVQMDHSGTVLAYNATESSYTGVDPQQAIGKHFFTEIAPCTNNFLVAGKYNEAALDEIIDYIFTYVLKPTPVRLRMLKGESPNMYLVVQKR